MFTVLLYLVGILVLVAGFFKFIYPNLESIFGFFTWARDIITALIEYVPSWLSGLAVVAVVLAAITLLVRLL